ncbi:AGL108Cp [Eremothecium gossypii ATCC 10895]|uniref:AGL108Cp n=1 Tax=Eremothecium gossypii (strain ATCC 10895 / CBS 109.51 / FGSC 9923 / NRRL Y-1056) TaxID=284811 RepID=Q750Q0_EREGS|nr:AGL108Cp [Eremothecium gossypii ATCC 10895]AAS54383.1 AGL108Cp [Eremothecium gossypii ATCC 10895]
MTDKAVAKLIEWLKTSELTFISDKIEIVQDAASGRGVRLKQCHINSNEEIIGIPSEFQLNFHSVLHHLSQFNRKLVVPGVTVTEPEGDADAEDPRTRAYGVLDANTVLQLSSFQLLALYILAEWVLLKTWGCETQSFWQPFFEIFPTSADLRAIPAYYSLQFASTSKELLPLLPPASACHCRRICELVQGDWARIRGILEQWNILFADRETITLEQQFEHFLHIYFVINSRCLYTPVPLKDNRDDNFTMVPYVDFLNHITTVSEHCYPKVESVRRLYGGVGRFSIKCGPHAYRVPMEEVFLNYGAHSNDFLLNEYGFTVDENEWDYIDVTEVVVSMIEKPEHVEFLREHDYYGDYTIAFDSVSFRVLVALALVATDDYERVNKYMMGYITDDYFGPRYSSLLLEVLQRARQFCEAALESAKKMTTADRYCTESVIAIYKGYLRILRHHLDSHTD